MTEIIIPSLYVFSGLCVYAFSGMCLWVSLSVISQIHTFQADSIPEFVGSNRTFIAFLLLFYSCGIWFFAIYTGKRPTSLLVGFNVVLIILFVVNLVSPFSLQYNQITQLKTMTLPWGESYIVAEGQSSPWLKLAYLLFMLIYSYMLYAGSCLYKQNRSTNVLGMLVAIIFLLASTVQGMLVRLSMVDTVPMGPFGFLAMIIVMSMILNHETYQQLKLSSLVFASTSEGLLITDKDNIIVAVNPAFREMTGYSAEEVVGRNPSILSSGRQNQSFYVAMWQTIKATGKWQGEIWNRRKNGEVYAEWLSINTIFNKDGSVNRRVGLFSDITKQKENEQLIWKQANLDELTGLLNRHIINERLEYSIRKSSRSSLKVALMMIDLDRFKEVNDTLGHELGDTLLKEAAQRMVGCLRETDALGRLGGDEFVVLLEDIDHSESVGRTASKLLEKLSAPYRLGHELAYISASIGITI
jgi:diguanylate cyclase (GGDEF)-like protein/PAS domain S-box-containing protein